MRAKRGILLFKARPPAAKNLRDQSAARGCAPYSLAGVRLMAMTYRRLSGKLGVRDKGLTSCGHSNPGMNNWEEKIAVAEGSRPVGTKYLEKPTTNCPGAP